ncbi:MAG: hypothetical protein LBO20_10800 [Bifidobacteriaceae bacterium]|nr:hypothetical protein [Bifidobacteriaceae bacterium]
MVKKLKQAAKASGLEFSVKELARHTSFTVGSSAHTLGRHAEIDEDTAHAFWDQFGDVLGGNGWWR